MTHLDPQRRYGSRIEPTSTLRTLVTLGHFVIIPGIARNAGVVPCRLPVSGHAMAMFNSSTPGDGRGIEGAATARLRSNGTDAVRVADTGPG